MMNASVQRAPPVAGILLAAGAGSRFGGGKLTHVLGDTAIGVRAARNLLAAGLSVTAVVRPGSDDLVQLLRAEGVTVSVCENAAEGMGVSLAHAIAYTAAQTPGVAGWVVALADMPHIRPETVRAVADAVREGALIAAPQFQNERGHPVGFNASLRDELLALKGDEGARAVLQTHRAVVRLIACDDPGVVYDIDCRADLGGCL